MREITDHLVKEGVIKPSVFPYASPAFLVCRPVKKPRLVIDYRKMNMNIEIEALPLPNIHTCFQWFSGAKYFSILDLSNAYFQIPLSEKSMPITAFVVPYGLYEFCRVPFGLSTGAQVLTRWLDTVLSLSLIHI